MIKTVIIDDEINSRELLQNMLTNHCENVEVLGMAYDVDSGIKLIKEQNPQLVFLDIEMPGGTGFDILNAFKKITFKVVFVTGYDNYGIKAIKYAALDYILKPVDLTELISAVEKANPETLGQDDKIKFLQSAYNNPSKVNEQVVISSHNGHSIINLKDILYLKAMDGYSIVVTENESKHIATHSLTYFEELLPPNQFFRIHKSYLINCEKVIGYDPGRGGNVSIQETISLPIATRRKPLFISFMNSLNP